MEGWFSKITRNSLGWLVLMGQYYVQTFHIFTISIIPYISFVGVLYILGAMFYALRVPERFYPGKFDLAVSDCVLFPVITALTDDLNTK